MANLPKEDLWTPLQLALVEDRSRQWISKNFEPSDSVAIPQGGQTVMHQHKAGEQPAPGAEIVTGGWDHEHCALCWETISQLPGDQPCGYTDGKEWLCSACHSSYILPRLT